MSEINWVPHKDKQEVFYGSLWLIRFQREGKTYYEIRIGKFKRQMTNYDKFVKEVRRLA